MNEVITLVGGTTTVNDIGDEVEVEAKVDVFARVKSVGASYKLQAMAVGIRPKYRFVLQDRYDYNGQEKVEYEGKTFRVVDTYRGEDQSIELTVAEV
ncbi:phage head closure protein [Pseudoflavonifractor sp. DSM 107456]|uniref:Phage head closure protein n=1 Tax=Pseudoflavonifractor gallinarum TaxID=2779352 RepID=A0ABR9R9B0_9FIRM|nr:phage head closure protein [Pseudoflavonifractor gallinarum]MBE5055284.1 phage head closure protein [Pseudoflavonifractor gallinarum]